MFATVMDVRRDADQLRFGGGVLVVGVESLDLGGRPRLGL